MCRAARSRTASHSRGCQPDDSDTSLSRALEHERLGAGSPAIRAGSISSRRGATRPARNLVPVGVQGLKRGLLHALAGSMFETCPRIMPRGCPKTAR